MVKSSAPRRRGRPSGADAQSASQRELLLDAALMLFAQQGIANTSLNAIARYVQVTPALVHYYFKNRTTLLDAVIEERLLPVLDRVVGPVATQQGNPRDIIVQLAERLLTTVAATPWLPPLWVREILSEGGQLRELLLSRIAPSVIEPMRELIRQAQAAGQINPQLEPGLVVVSLMGLTIFPLAAAPIWRQLPGNEGISTETLVRHMLSLLAHGLEPLDVHTI
jgi:TetR/AcrR family transcriptional regulator